MYASVDSISAIRQIYCHPVRHVIFIYCTIRTRCFINPWYKVNVCLFRISFVYVDSIFSTIIHSTPLQRWQSVWRDSIFFGIPSHLICSNIVWSNVFRQLLQSFQSINVFYILYKHSNNVDLSTKCIYNIPIFLKIKLLSIFVKTFLSYILFHASYSKITFTAF